MPKDTYYFSHDSNARNDIKMIKLRRALGMEGYGIYFALIEILREQDEFKLPLESISDIAFELHTSEEKVRTIISVYDLFVIENEQFFSARLLRSMDELSAKRQKYVEAGKKGGEASVKHRLSNAQPLNILKESKVKESKVFIAPSIDEVKAYFIESGYSESSGVMAYKYYSSSDWKDKNGNQVKNWKQKMIAVWFKDENKIIKDTQQSRMVY